MHQFNLPKMFRAGVSLALAFVTTTCYAATQYPPPSSGKSEVYEGSVYLRPGANGATIARVSATVAATPYTVVATKQQVDDDSLDVLVTFNGGGSFLAQTFTSEVAVGVLPAQVKRVRFLSRVGTLPVVQQAEIDVSQQCLSFDSGVSRSVSEFETIALPIRTVGAAIPGRLLNVVQTASALDVYVDTQLGTDVCPSPNATATQTLGVQLPGRPAADLTVRLRHNSGAIAGLLDVTVAQRATPLRASSLELRSRGSYFLAATLGDSATLLALKGPSGEQVWASADDGFYVWPAQGAVSPAAASVCRFFNSQLSTHFYSASESDCSALRVTPGWTDEGIAFKILLPEAQVCPRGSAPIYRLFSASLANHRYTRNFDNYLAMRKLGWTGEGVAFCSPRQL